MTLCPSLSFFLFNDTATTEIYTLSLHDALPIFEVLFVLLDVLHVQRVFEIRLQAIVVVEEDQQADLIIAGGDLRSEEHTSELQSHSDLVCRLLLEKKKK